VLIFNVFRVDPDLFGQEGPGELFLAALMTASICLLALQWSNWISGCSDEKTLKI
jgi:hypothetical protein